MIIMKNQLINQLKSSVTIQVKGKNIERFIKRIMQLHIDILDLQILKYNEAMIRVYQNDLEQIEKIKTIYEIDIIRYFGLTRIKLWLKKNQYLIFFLLIGFLILYVFTHLIFKIEIIHDNKEIRNLLRKELKEYGITEKHFKKSYSEIQKIKKKILKRYKNKIEWMEIEEKGTTYLVRVEERIITKQKQTAEFQNIVAKKSAILRKIEASSGEIVKNIHNYVSKGDVVITGDIRLNEQTKDIVSADGKIYGEVWYKTTVEYPLHYQETILLPEKKTVYALKLLNHSFSIEWNRYPTKKITEKILFQNNLVPVQLVQQRQTKTKVIKETYSQEEAVLKAVQKAKLKIESKLSDNEYIIYYKQLNIDKNDSKIIVELFFSVCEDITATAPISLEQP